MGRKTLLAVVFLIFLCPLIAVASDKIPVVVVPGFLASWNDALFIGQGLENKWKFSLDDDTYNRLIQSFIDDGYVLNQNLFVAFYDWRQSNRDNYRTYLLPIIDRALTLNPGADWVDVVAHSMGGIFTRAYIQNTDDYRGDVRHFIMIATPNHGAAESYYLWSGGSFPPSMHRQEKLKVAAFLFYRGLTHAPPIYSRRQLIQTEIKSAEELLPTYDFLVDINTGLDLPVAGMQAQNPLLPTMNDYNARDGIFSVADNVAQLTIIAGRGRDTIERIAVETKTIGQRWYDGRPIPGGIAYSQTGDGTVLGRSSFFPLPRINFECLGGEPPVLSWLIPVAHACDPLNFVYGQESIPGWDTIRQEYIYDAGHRDIVTKAIPIVHQVINQDYIPGVIYQEPDDDPEEILTFAIASPLDPLVIAPDGRRLGKDLNELGDGAMYHDTGDPLGPKILMIENPDEGTYHLESTGTGVGDFHVGVIKITAETNDPIGSSDEVIVPTIAGTTTMGEQQSFEIESLGEGLVVEGEVYGELPVQQAEALAQNRLRQLINVLHDYQQSGDIKPATADILHRLFLSRVAQLDARDNYANKGKDWYADTLRFNSLQQLTSHQSYVEFMTSLRQISEDARDGLLLILQQVIDVV